MLKQSRKERRFIRLSVMPSRGSEGQNLKLSTLDIFQNLKLILRKMWNTAGILFYSNRSFIYFFIFFKIYNIPIKFGSSTKDPNSFCRCNCNYRAFQLSWLLYIMLWVQLLLDKAWLSPSTGHYPPFESYGLTDTSGKTCSFPHLHQIDSLIHINALERQWHLSHKMSANT